MKILLVTGALWVLLTSSVKAQGVKFEDGFFADFSLNASIMSRQKGINYGRFLRGDPASPTNLRDVAASPGFVLGYEFGESNSITLKGDWAYYVSNRTLVENLGVPAIDGSLAGFFAVDAVRRIDIDWDSSVSNVEAEYQRRLYSRSMVNIRGLLGFRYRYESQTFNVNKGIPVTFAKLKEQLTEHLYGPYAGGSILFKFREGSGIKVNLHTRIGYLFKWANFRGEQNFSTIMPSFVTANDTSSVGTAFSNAGIYFMYQMNRNWSVGAEYEFTWMNSVTNIFNADVGFQRSRIEESYFLAQDIGVRLKYEF